MARQDLPPYDDDDDEWGVEARNPRRDHGGIGILALLVVLVLLGMRVLAEWQMMEAHGPDAQMGIWVMFSCCAGGFWLVTGGILAMLLDFGWYDTVRRRVILGLGAVWILLIGFSSYQYYSGARALTDAANHAT